MSDMMEFDVQGTAKWIVNRGLLKVALQLSVMLQNCRLACMTPFCSTLS